jgi:hypothetical protein
VSLLILKAVLLRLHDRAVRQPTRPLGTLNELLIPSNTFVADVFSETSGSRRPEREPVVQIGDTEAA